MSCYGTAFASIGHNEGDCKEIGDCIEKWGKENVVDKGTGIRTTTVEKQVPTAKGSFPDDWHV